MSIMNIGLSGLKSTQKALEVTSNNIANSSTAGFKEGRTEFAAVYNGGQRGGVTVSDIRENFSKGGSTVNTGYALDLAISGAGFFVVSDNGRVAYTQAGQFKLDNDKNIVNANNAKLQGYGISETIDPTTGKVTTNLVPGVMTDLKIEATNIPAQATSRVDFSLNLSSASNVITLPAAPAVFDPADGANYNYSQSTELFDSLGNSHTLTQYFNHLGNNEWAVTYYMNGNPLSAADIGGALGNVSTTTISALNTDGTAVAAAAVRLSFGTDGQLRPVADGTTGATPPDDNKDDFYNVREIVLSFTPPGALPMSVGVDMVKTTQFGSGFTMYQNDADGYTAGEYSGVSVTEDGSVYATFSNGATKLQGQLVLASFASVDGLENGNNTLWYATQASGNALYGTAAENRFGNILAGAYIGSNVDISEQLVDLMAFQQNYQANAKTISSADEMMQILFNAT